MEIKINMNKIIFLTALIFASLFSSCYAQSIGDVAKGVVNEMNEAKEVAKNEDVQKEKKPVVEIISRCESEYITRMEINECKLMGAAPLAESGNFVAQHFIGQLFASDNNKEQALKWYNDCINNPRTIEGYKKIVIKEKERL